MLKKWMIVAVVLSVGLIYAQDQTRPRRTPPSDAIQNALGLSGDQLTSLRQIQTDWRTNARDTFAQIHEKQMQLREEMAKDSPNAVLAGQLMVDSKALQTQIGESRKALKDQAAALLTDEQRAKLAELEAAAALLPAIAQARGLSLLEGGEGPGGEGPGHFGGPRGFGAGPGPEPGFGGPGFRGPRGGGFRGGQR